MSVTPLHIAACKGVSHQARRMCNLLARMNDFLRNKFWESALSGLQRVHRCEEKYMGRYLLLWLLGVPIPILLLVWLFAGLH
jgi:hypothetical protein